MDHTDKKDSNSQNNRQSNNQGSKKRSRRSFQHQYQPNQNSGSKNITSQNNSQNQSQTFSQTGSQMDRQIMGGLTNKQRKRYSHLISSLGYEVNSLQKTRQAQSIQNAQKLSSQQKSQKLSQNQVNSPNPSIRNQQQTLIQRQNEEKLTQQKPPNLQTQKSESNKFQVEWSQITFQCFKKQNYQSQLQKSSQMDNKPKSTISQEQKPIISLDPDFNVNNGQFSQNFGMNEPQSQNLNTFQHNEMVDNTFNNENIHNQQVYLPQRMQIQGYQRLFHENNQQQMNENERFNRNNISENRSVEEEPQPREYISSNQIQIDKCVGEFSNSKPISEINYEMIRTIYTPISQFKIPRKSENNNKNENEEYSNNQAILEASQYCEKPQINNEYEQIKQFINNQQQIQIDRVTPGNDELERPQINHYDRPGNDNYEKHLNENVYNGQQEYEKMQIQTNDYQLNQNQKNYHQSNQNENNYEQPHQYELNGQNNEQLNNYNMNQNQYPNDQINQNQMSHNQYHNDNNNQYQNDNNNQYQNENNNNLEDNQISYPAMQIQGQNNNNTNNQNLFVQSHNQNNNQFYNHHQNQPNQQIIFNPPFNQYDSSINQYDSSINQQNQSFNNFQNQPLNNFQNQPLNNFQNQSNQFSNHNQNQYFQHIDNNQNQQFVSISKNQNQLFSPNKFQNSNHNHKQQNCKSKLQYQQLFNQQQSKPSQNTLQNIKPNHQQINSQNNTKSKSQKLQYIDTNEWIVQKKQLSMVVPNQSNPINQQKNSNKRKFSQTARSLGLSTVNNKLPSSKKSSNSKSSSKKFAVSQTVNLDSRQFHSFDQSYNLHPPLPIQQHNQQQPQGIDFRKMTPNCFKKHNQSSNNGFSKKTNRSNKSLQMSPYNEKFSPQIEPLTIVKQGNHTRVERKSRSSDRENKSDRSRDSRSSSTNKKSYDDLSEFPMEKIQQQLNQQVDEKSIKKSRIFSLLPISIHHQQKQVQRQISQFSQTNKIQELNNSERVYYQQQQDQQKNVQSNNFYTNQQIEIDGPIYIDRQVQIDKPVNVERQTQTDRTIYYDQQVQIDRPVYVQRQMQMDRIINIDTQTQIDRVISIDRQIQIDRPVNVDQQIQIDQPTYLDREVQIDRPNYYDMYVQIDRPNLVDRQTQNQHLSRRFTYVVAYQISIRNQPSRMNMNNSPIISTQRRSPQVVVIEQSNDSIQSSQTLTVDQSRIPQQNIPIRKLKISQINKPSKPQQNSDIDDIEDEIDSLEPQDLYTKSNRSKVDNKKQIQPKKKPMKVEKRVTKKKQNKNSQDQLITNSQNNDQLNQNISGAKRSSQINQLASNKPSPIKNRSKQNSLQRKQNQKQTKGILKPSRMQKQSGGQRQKNYPSKASLQKQSKNQQNENVSLRKMNEPNRKQPKLQISKFNNRTTDDEYEQSDSGTKSPNSVQQSSIATRSMQKREVKVVKFTNSTKGGDSTNKRDNRKNAKMGEIEQKPKAEEEPFRRNLRSRSKK